MPRRARKHVAHLTHPLTGKQFAVRAHSERELESYRHRIAQLREQLRLGMVSADDVDRTLRRVIHGVVRLDKAARAYAARPELAPNTARRVLSFVAGAGAELAPLELEQLDAARIGQWIGRFRKQHIPTSTLTTHWRTLRAVVRYAAERGWIGRFPWGDWRPTLKGTAARTSRECLRTVGELAQLLNAARELDEVDAYNYEAIEAKIAIAALSGARQGELAGLRWSDLIEEENGGGGVILLARQWEGAPIKTGKSARLCVPAELFAIVNRHRDRLAARQLFEREGPVFPACLGHPWGPSGGKLRHIARGGECLSRGALRAAVERAQLPNVQRWSAHSLRDSFVTLEASAREGDWATVARRSRHASLASLSRYVRSLGRGEPAPGFTIPPSSPPPKELLP
jgi:integrase